MRVMSITMSDTNSLVRLMEVIESLRKETVQKLGELESRVDRGVARGKRDLAELMGLVYSLSDAVAMTYYLELFIELKRGSPSEINEALVDLLRAWKEVIIRTKEVFGLVDWSMVQERSEPILRLARKGGLPFHVVAARVLEVMGPDARKFLKEDAISNIYGLMSLNQWRRMISSK